MDVVAVGRFALMQRWNFARKPDWRWQRAGDLVQQHKRLDPRWDDPATRQAARYLRGELRPRRRSSVDAPTIEDIRQAHEFHQQAGRRMDLLEACVLSGMDLPATADRVGISVPVVEAIEALFFDVRPYRSAKAYIILNAFGGLGLKGSTPAGLLKRFAYAGGPFVLEACADELLADNAHKSKLYRQFLPLIEFSSKPHTWDELLAAFEGRIRRGRPYRRRAASKRKPQGEPERSQTNDAVAGAPQMGSMNLDFEQLLKELAAKRLQ